MPKNLCACPQKSPRLRDERIGDLASSETPERPTVAVSRADKARVFDEQLRLLKQEAMWAFG